MYQSKQLHAFRSICGGDLLAHDVMRQARSRPVVTSSRIRKPPLSVLSSADQATRHREEFEKFEHCRCTPIAVRASQHRTDFLYYLAVQLRKAVLAHASQIFEKNLRKNELATLMQTVTRTYEAETGGSNWKRRGGWSKRDHGPERGRVNRGECLNAADC